MAGILVVVLMFAVLVGCGGQDKKAESTTVPGGSTQAGEATTEKAPRDLIDVTIALWDIQEYQGNPAGEQAAAYIKDRFAINVKPINLQWGDWEEKIRMFAASGDLPDVFPSQGWTDRKQYKDWVDQGVIRDIPEAMAAKYPEIAKVLKTYDYEKLPDGKFYHLPRTDYATIDKNGFSQGLLYRKDYAKNVGFENIGSELSWDDLTKLLYAFAKNDPDKNGKPDTYGITSAEGVTFFQALYVMNGFESWVSEDGKWIPGHISNAAKVTTKWLKQLYQDGVIDPEFAINKDDRLREKLVTGKVGCISYNSNLSNIRNEVRIMYWDKVNPDKKIDEYVDLLPLVTGMDGKKQWRGKTYWSVSHFPKSLDDNKLDRILELYNWLYSSEGFTYMYYGEEGKDYKLENGQITSLREADEAGNTIFYDQSKLGPMVSLAGWHLEGVPGVVDPTTTEWDLAIDKKLQDSYWTHMKAIPFTNYVVSPEFNKFNIDEYSSGEFVKIIMQGKDFESDWDKYVKSVYAEYNAQAVIDEVNEEAKKRNIQP